MDNLWSFLWQTLTLSVVGALLLLVNLGGMAFLSSASAIPLLLRRKSPAAMLRIAIGTAISLSALGILFLLKDLPV